MNRGRRGESRYRWTKFKGVSEKSFRVRGRMKIKMDLKEEKERIKDCISKKKRKRGTGEVQG